MRIDTHQHFWTYDPERYSWIDDSMAAIRRDFLPADLQPVLKENRIDGSISVEAHSSEDETRSLLQQAEENSFIKGIIGWVDLLSPSVDKRLQHFSAFRKFKGVRHAVQSEADINFVLREDFNRGVRHLKDYDLIYEILIFPHYLPAIIKFVKNHPLQKFILNHLAKPCIKDNVLEPWASQIKDLARMPNVYCKISGMVTEADFNNWREDHFKPYMDVILEAFGTYRTVFGSDWPVCLVAASYKQVLSIVENYISPFSDQEKERIMGLNAAEFYGIGI